MARYGADQAAMSAGQDITTGPGGGNPLLINPLPIIPVVPVLPVVPSNPTRSDYNDAARPVSERTLTIAGAGTLLPTIFGLDQTGAKITAIVDYGANLILRCEWCTGGIDSVNALYMDDAVAPAGVIATHYDGSQVTADATLVAAFAAKGKTYTDTLNGVCYSTLVVPPGLGNGFPRFVAEIKGKKIAQTSGGTPAYTQNGVWFIAWLITQRLGESINWASFTAAATASGDTMVGSPAEKKRILGLTLDNEQSVTQWISLLLGYTGCALWYDNGEWGITAETATYTAPFSVTEALMKDGEIDVQSRNVKNAPTVVRIWYTNTSAIPWREEYAEASLPGAGSTLPYLLSEVRMPAIQRYSHAYREAYEQLYDYQLGDLTASFITRDQGLKIMPGDVFPITHSIGFSAKPFRCVSMPEPVDAGRWRVQTREFDPAKYSTAVVTGPTFTDTSLPSPATPPTVTGLVLTEIVEAPGPGGTPSSSISATVTPVTWPFLSGYVWYVYDDSGALVDQETTVGPAWRTHALPAPQRCTVYCKARSVMAVGSAFAAARITLSGTTQSLTLLASTRVYSAGATLTNFESYTLYPGDPYLRVNPIPGANATFAQQFFSTAISAAVPSVLAHDRYLTGQTRADTNAKTAAIDLGAVKTVVAALAGGPSVIAGVREIGFEAAASLAGPWTFARGTVVSISGRYIRLVAWGTEGDPVLTFPDGGSGPSGGIFGGGGYTVFYPFDFGAATISVYGQTVEETGADTTSVSGPITVTLANKYAALRDLQVSAVQSGGTAVVTADAPSLSITLANTFQINATVSGTRVAVPVRWSFKGAL